MLGIKEMSDGSYRKAAAAGLAEMRARGVDRKTVAKIVTAVVIDGLIAVLILPLRIVASGALALQLGFAGFAAWSYKRLGFPGAELLPTDVKIVWEQEIDPANLKAKGCTCCPLEGPSPKKPHVVGLDELVPSSSSPSVFSPPQRCDSCLDAFVKWNVQMPAPCAACDAVFREWNEKMLNPRT